MAEFTTMIREEVTAKSLEDAIWPFFNNQCNDVPSGTLYLL